MRSVFALFVVGLLAGGWLGWPSGAAPEPTPPAPKIEPPPARVVELQLPSDCEGRRAALDAEIDRLERALAAARLTARVQEAERVRREGAPVPWPDDVDPRLAPDAFRAAITTAAEASGVARVHDVDCAEYPCLVTLELTVRGVVGGTSINDYDPVFEALGYDDIGLVAGTASGFGDNAADGKFGVFAFGPEGLPPETLTRISFRIDKAAEYARADLEPR